jgi:hypothetical protein
MSKGGTDLVNSFLDHGMNYKMGFGDLNVLLEMQERQLKLGEFLLRNGYSYHTTT